MYLEKKRTHEVFVWFSIDHVAEILLVFGNLARNFVVATLRTYVWDSISCMFHSTQNNGIYLLQKKKKERNFHLHEKVVMIEKSFHKNEY